MSAVPDTLPVADRKPSDTATRMQAGSIPTRNRPLIAGCVCAICGIVLTLPFRGYDGSFPSFVAIAPVFWIVVNERRARRAALYAACFALTWTTFCFTFLWPLTFGGAIALSIYTSLFYVLGLMLIRRIAQGRGTLAVIGTASVWALVEITRSVVPVFGFPWLLLGHTLLFNDRLRQGADLLGVYGLSFIVAAVNAAIAFALPELFPDSWRTASKHRAWRTLCFAGALVLAAFAYGEARIQGIEKRLIDGPPIGVIQGNIVQKLGRSEEERKAQLEGHMELHRQLLQKCKAEGEMPVLVCWAETMVPGTLNADDQGRTFQKFVGSTGVPALVGSQYMPREDFEKDREQQHIYNTAFLLDGEGKEVFHFFKRRIVPFGEYIPFVAQFPFLKHLQSVLRDQYTPGTDPSPIGHAGAYHFALNICVEDIHPCLARECSRAGADTLINLTNDGWWYGTYEPRAHFQAAAWRAIEVRRPMLRVTNTGITAAIDPLGNIATIIQPETVGIAKVRLLGIESATAGEFATPMTLTMWLGEFGSGAIFISLFLGCLFFAQDRT